MNRLTKCVCLLLILACPTPGRSEGVRVFYTGHSFHMFVPRLMTQLTKAGEVKEYRTVGSQGIGGSRVIQHWTRADDRNKAKQILKSAGTDVFTMAPNVKMPDEGIDRFAELGLKHNPKLRLLVQESWVPGDYLGKRIKNNTQRDETDLTKLRADQETWRKQMEAQAKAINKKAGREAVSIVPVGAAVVKLREMVDAGKVPGVKKQSELFRDPIGHGNAAIRLLCAYCNYVCITGKNPVGLKVKVQGVTDEVNALLQQIAWETVSTYPMSGVKKPE